MGGGNQTLKSFSLELTNSLIYRSSRKIRRFRENEDGGVHENRNSTNMSLVL